jgi:hypothetical protein
VRLNNPGRERNTHSNFLSAIWVPIVLEIFPYGLISEPAVGSDHVTFDDILRTFCRLW